MRQLIEDNRLYFSNNGAEKYRRTIAEIGLIVFLFYSNLLMGEYTRSAPGRAQGLLWALHDACTTKNLFIALTAAVIGYLVVESLRERL